MSNYRGFAPGPWKAYGKTIKSVHHQRHYSVARVDNKLFTPEANEANARLIAAAPELLEVLQEAMASAMPLSVRTEWQQGDGCTNLVEIIEWPDWLVKARAAMTKAKGVKND